MMQGEVVQNPLSDRAQRLIELNAELVGSTCPVCASKDSTESEKAADTTYPESREVVAVDVARSGIEPDPAHGVRSDVERGSVLLAHSDTPGDYCVLEDDVDM